MALVWQPSRAGRARWQGILAALRPAPPRARVGGPPAATGDDAFEAFYARHQRDIFGYLWRMVGDEQAAHDLTQETFVRAWQRFDTIAQYDQPRAWLFRVATNLALNFTRERATRLRALLPFTRPADGDSRAAPEQPIARDHADAIAEREVVRAALLALPPRDRAALVLQSVYGLSCVELADALGLSVGAVKTLLWRGRERFRACYLADEEGSR